MKAKKLPSGNYRVQVVAGHDENGKRIVKSFTAAEEWEAIKLATDFACRREQNYDRNMTVAQAMEMYIESRRNVLEETTIRDYNQVLKYRFGTLRFSNRMLESRSICREQSFIEASIFVKSVVSSVKEVLIFFGVSFIYFPIPIKFLFLFPVFLMSFFLCCFTN